MNNALALSILALTISLSIMRPVVWHIRIQPPMAAVLGAALMLMLGIVSHQEAEDALRLLRFPVITIVSLMAMTLVAEQAGPFRLLAWRVVAAGAVLFTTVIAAPAFIYPLSGRARRGFAWAGLFVGLIAGYLLSREYLEFLQLLKGDSFA